MGLINHGFNVFPILIECEGLPRMQFQATAPYLDFLSDDIHFSNFEAHIVYEYVLGCKTNIFPNSIDQLMRPMITRILKFASKNTREKVHRYF